MADAPVVPVPRDLLNALLVDGIDQAKGLLSGGETDPEVRRRLARYRNLLNEISVVPAEPLTVDESVRCSEYTGSDDPEDIPEDGGECGEVSRYQVSRSDRDPSFGSGGGTEEACDAHLAGVVGGMVAGDSRVCAIVAIRWDGPEAGAGG